MSPRIFPTGTTLHDSAHSWKGYVLFGAPDRRTHLVDLAGNDVHTWPHRGFPSELIAPAVNGGKLGHVLVQLDRTVEGGRFNGIFDNRSVGELDWDGRVVWSWSGGSESSAARQTHDIERLPNGNTLLLTSVARRLPGFTPPDVTDQVLREVDAQGNVVWSWSVAEHLEQFGIPAEGLALLRRGRGQNGRIFQVTPRGKVVWEYVNPHVARTQIGSREIRSNWVYRAQPVLYEWVPSDTARSERDVAELDPSSFRVPH